jgi:hypothetical protein
MRPHLEQERRTSWHAAFGKRSNSPSNRPRRPVPQTFPKCHTRHKRSTNPNRDEESPIRSGLSSLRRVSCHGVFDIQAATGPALLSPRTSPVCRKPTNAAPPGATTTMRITSDFTRTDLLLPLPYQSQAKTPAPRCPYPCAFCAASARLTRRGGRDTSVTAFVPAPARASDTHTEDSSAESSGHFYARGRRYMALQE